MKMNAVLFLPILCSCSTFDSSWEQAPLRYQCTVEQMARVETETRFCASETGYTSEQCYGTAMIRNCKRTID